MKAVLENLKNALLELNPTGSHGFEGLMATILEKITGHTFRLAKSGSQFGRDGEAVSVDTHISFEAKLYSGKINSENIQSKVFEIIGSAYQPDLWVLGATVEINIQLLGKLRSVTDRNGLSILELDWPDNATIPPLAAACALAENKVGNFLSQHLQDQHVVDNANNSIQAIRSHDAFKKEAANIKRRLEEPSLGIATALEANKVWLKSVFSNRRKAIRIFGQPLAPYDEAIKLKPFKRESLLKEAEQKVFGKPKKELVALIGDEGCGKSWLFALSWLRSRDRPLTVVIPADAIGLIRDLTNIEEFLIALLLSQTRDRETNFHIKRWHNFFNMMKAGHIRLTPTLVVFIDGLNQHPDFDWPRWLDALCQTLEELGGSLVVSCRTGFFESRLKMALVSQVSSINISEWTDSELTQILNQKKINFEELHPKVKRSFKNPRLLSVALEVIDVSNIEDVNEISVEMLLFEHIRLGHRDRYIPENPDIFKKRLSQHAQEILDRTWHKNDALEFDVTFGPGHEYKLSQGLLAASEGRFYQPLDSDPTQYEISEDGFVVAIGLAVISNLKKVDRNGEDLASALHQILDPIASLDKTAEVIFASTIIASIEGAKEEIQKALICEFLRLQNIDTGCLPAFASILRRNVDLAMNVLFNLSISERRVPHKGWLLNFLYEQGNQEENWRVQSTHLQKWLRYYSLSAKWHVQKTYPSGLDQKKEAQKLEERERKLNEAYQGLSELEKRFLNEKMVRKDEIDFETLADNAFTLMNGKPLWPFTEALVASSLSISLNGTFLAPREKFICLILFNRQDWDPTRKQLLEKAAFLKERKTSKAGKWALVRILRATSTEEDATKEKTLLQELTADQERFHNFHSTEKFCKTDPCDPTASEPDNIEEMAKGFQTLDYTKLFQSQWMSIEDNCLRKALPGLARFSPTIAINFLTEFAEKTVERKGDKYRYGLFSVEPNAALLSDRQVSRFMEKAVELAKSFDENAENKRDSWIDIELSMFLAFSHFDGTSQLEALMSVPSHGPSLQDLADVFRPVDTRLLEEALKTAIESGDASKQAALLFFTLSSKTKISGQIIELIRGLISSPDSSIRTMTMNIVVHKKIGTLVENFLDSGWTAKDRISSDDKEVLLGGIIIILGGKLGFLATEEVLDRISPRHYSFGSIELGEDFTRVAVDRLDAAMRRAIEVEIPLHPPQVKQNQNLRSISDSPSLSLCRDNPSQKEMFQRLFETPRQYAERQRQGWESLDRFRESLTRQQAILIVENVGIEIIRSWLKMAPEQVKGWAETIQSLTDSKLMRVRNIGLFIGEVLSETYPALAKDLFEHLTGKRSFVNLTYDGNPLEGICIWNGANNHEMNALRERRLDRAPTDAMIATEVLCALTYGKADFLKNYVNNRLKKPEPVAKARALMVCGFGTESEESKTILEKHNSTKGLIGIAAKAASFAYQRNIWSRFWFKQMCQASSPEDFWRFSVLFLKIVDARYRLWQRQIMRRGEPSRKFEPTIQGKLQNRINKWHNKRQKTLFGNKAPDPSFLS